MAISKAHAYVKTGQKCPFRPSCFILKQNWSKKKIKIKKVANNPSIHSTVLRTLHTTRFPDKSPEFSKFRCSSNTHFHTCPPNYFHTLAESYSPLIPLRPLRTIRRSEQRRTSINASSSELNFYVAWRICVATFSGKPIFFFSLSLVDDVRRLSGNALSTDSNFRGSERERERERGSISTNIFYRVFDQTRICTKSSADFIHDLRRGGTLDAAGGPQRKNSGKFSILDGPPIKEREREREGHV